MKSGNVYLGFGLLFSLLCHCAFWLFLQHMPAMPQPKQFADSCLVAVRVTSSPSALQAEKEQLPPRNEPREQVKPKPLPERKAKATKKAEPPRKLLPDLEKPMEMFRATADPTPPQPVLEKQSGETLGAGEAQPVFGIGAASLAAGNSGGMALPQGNTLQGKTGGPLFADKNRPRQGVVPTFQLSSLPEYSRRVEPAYPQALADSEIQGKVLLLVTIEPDGSVGDVDVKQADHPLFADAAVAAMKQCVFKPATQDGTAVAARIEIPVRFVLENT